MDSVQIISPKSLLLQFTIFRILGSKRMQVSPLIWTALEATAAHCRRVGKTLLHIIQSRVQLSAHI